MQTHSISSSSPSDSTTVPALARETFAPPIDVFENAEELLVVVDLPGVAPEDVTLGFSDNVLTLNGSRNGGRQEFVRTLSIRTQVDAEKIHAESKNGTLYVHLPKAEKAKPRKIPVRVG